MAKIIAIVRHGQYGSSCDESLSENGEKQIWAVRDSINGYLGSVFEEGRLEPRLTFSFSTQARAIQSAAILREGRDIVVTNLFLPNRDEIDFPDQHVEMVMNHMEHWGVEIAVIVAHGDMPAVFAETVINALDKENQVGLDYSATGSGYLVNLDTPAVFHLSDLGLKAIDKSGKIIFPEQDSSDIESEHQTLEDDVPISADADVSDDSHDKVIVNSTPTVNFEDDDIPF